jgi:hypothetical protein
VARLAPAHILIGFCDVGEEVEEAIIKLVTIRIAAYGLLSLVSIAYAHAAEPRAGSWKLVSAQSSLDPPNRLLIVSAAGTVHVLMTGEIHLDFTAKSDGKLTPAPSNPLFDEVQIKRIDKKQAEVIEKKNGAEVGTIRNVLSKNGKELTLTTSRPGNKDQISIWSRTGAAKGVLDPFAGNWIEDMSKTRMGQGAPLKIDAIGADGVRFAYDYSYTAHFDGKRYDLHNSPNDTVQLTQVDAHSVDAIYRRDEQITQRDQWMVAPDGKTMTLLSTGTLQSGQKFTEKLVFERE